MLTDTGPPCKCHGVAQMWKLDRRPRYTLGGHWQCRVKHTIRRVRSETPRRETILAYGRDWAREKYDRDPVHRITKREKLCLRRRAVSLERKRQQLSEERKNG
jgi:hypothetical protein